MPGFIGSVASKTRPDEDSLQNWLEEAFSNQGYQCYNWHKKERVNEKGMDIECRSADEKVALALKVRPKKEDIPQLRKFSKVRADRHVYIYWDEPTREFQNELTKSGVSVLTGKELGDFLVEHASFKFLKWQLINCDTLQQVAKSIFEIYECEHVSKRDFSRTDLDLIWRLKSSAVKLKADIRLSKNYFSDKILQQMDPQAAATMTGEALDQLEMMQGDGEELYEIVTRTEKEAPHILGRFIEHVSGRTGGVDLHHAVRQADKASRRTAIESWLIEDKEVHKFISAYSWLHEALENLEDRFSLLSQGVDWVFEDALLELWGLVGMDVSDE